MADRVWVACADGTREKLNKLAGSAGGLNKLCAAALEALVDPNRVSVAPPPIPSPRAVSLDDACEVILRVIDESQAALIRSLCQESRQSPSAYILSYIKLANERGETGVVTQEVMADRPVSLAPLESVATCQFCGKPFVPARAGQRFCPDLADDGVTLSCGKRAHLEEVHGKRKRELSEKAATVIRETLA